MRRLNRLIRQERGASAVLFGLLLIPLLGSAAIAVDVGALYSDKASLQNGADAAALQVAIACAANETSPTCLSASPSGIAGLNDPANGAAIQSVAVNTSSNLVTVGVQTADLGVRHPLASLLPGVGSSTIVRASGSAEWGVPVSGPAIALAVGVCEFENHQPQTPPTKIVVQYETVTRHNCGPLLNAPGGFGWLPSSDCTIFIDISSPWVPSKTGNSTSGTGCTEAGLAKLLGTTIFVPIYDDFMGTGNNVQFHIAKFAAFTLTGFKVSGSNAYVDPTAPIPAGGGNWRGLQGFFVKYVSVSDVFKLGDPGPGDDLGAYLVRLTLRTS